MGSSPDPLENKLLALENQSIQKQKSNLAAQRAAEQTRWSEASVSLPEPNLHETSDVVGATTAPAKEHRGVPIGKVSN